MKPKLFEALMQSNTEQREIYEKIKRKHDHPFLNRYMETGITEGLFSDMTNALGKMHDSIVGAAWPELIGRSLIVVRPTTETMERFPLDEKSVAYRYTEGAVTRLSGKKNSTVDISTNSLAESSEAWTREFVEDATWNVMDDMIEKVGRALGEDETNRILAVYGAVADADLAGGALISGGNAVLGWAGLLALHNAVRGENWRPTVLVVNEMQLHQLLNDDKFVHGQYLTSNETDLDQGIISSVLGMKVHSSTLVPNGTAYAIDTRVAAVMLLRRDVTTEDWEDVKKGEFGIRATTRFGIGVLRSKAIAKMTNIKTTLT